MGRDAVSFTSDLEESQAADRPRAFRLFRDKCAESYGCARPATAYRRSMARIAATPRATTALADRENSTKGWAWLRDNPVLEPTHRIFMSLVFAWAALASAAILAALAMCIAAPLLGWFIAPSKMPILALEATFFWVMGSFAIFGAWVITAATVGLANVAVRRHR